MKKTAVLLPCYNEELTIAKVIADFRKALPEADIYVYDNNSTDRSRELAEQADSYQFAAALRAEGVVTGGGYNAPLHLHPVFHELDFFRQGRPTVLAFGQRDVRQGPGSLPVAETLHNRIFDLPWFKHFDPEAIRLHAGAFRKVVDNIGELK